MKYWEKIEIIDMTLECLYIKLKQGNHTTETTLNIVNAIEKLENLKKKLGE